MNWLTLRILLILFTVVLLIGSYLMVHTLGIGQLLIDAESLRTTVINFGASGPFLVIVLMMLAIIFNPLPSAPIALVAGAVYGHTWGTLYVIIGASLGAVTAFLIARICGYELVRKYLGDRISLGRWGTQNSLMYLIFISRLIPFVSFDLMSYAAGLTSLRLWRFTIATLLGLIPVSFLLTHFGGEIREFNVESISLFILLTALIVMIPVIVKIINPSFFPKLDEIYGDKK